MSNKILFFFAVFLTASAVFYSIVPKKRRYVVLLAMSLLCICFFSGTGVVFILAETAAVYIAGLLMDSVVKKNETKGLDKQLRKQIKTKVKKKKQAVVFCCAAFCLGILFVLKYFNFFFGSINFPKKSLGFDSFSISFKVVVPLGLSYFTLQALSYLIDVYRGKYPAEKNILKLALFVSFFPQLNEGPFGRYDDLSPQFCAGKDITADSAYTGAARILWGLFKIFMVANRASVISDAIFGDYEKYGGFTVLLGGAAFTLQLYAEFSGYIDIARGVSEVFSVELAENFNMPFLAQNVADFWRRWHISLGAFFRDYIFYSVSASRWLRKLGSKLKPRAADFVTLSVSLFTVWYLTGLWHGASLKYICYGLYYFVLILGFNLLSPLTERLLKRVKIDSGSRGFVCFRIIKTFIFVLIGMIMFRAENMKIFGVMLSSLVRSGEPFDISAVIDIKDMFMLIISFFVIVVSALLKLRGFDTVKCYRGLSSYRKYAICFAAFCFIMIFGAYGLTYIPPDPIYGGF